MYYILGVGLLLSCLCIAVLVYLDISIFHFNISIFQYYSIFRKNTKISKKYRGISWCRVWTSLAAILRVAVPFTEGPSAVLIFVASLDLTIFVAIIFVFVIRGNRVLYILLFFIHLVSSPTPIEI